MKLNGFIILIEIHFKLKSPITPAPLVTPSLKSVEQRKSRHRNPENEYENDFSNADNQISLNFCISLVLILSRL